MLLGLLLQGVTTAAGVLFLHWPGDVALIVGTLISLAWGAYRYYVDMRTISRRNKNEHIQPNHSPHS